MPKSGQGRWVRKSGPSSGPQREPEPAALDTGASESAPETSGVLVPSLDTSAARWIEERLWKWSDRGLLVGSVVPEGFAAYARVLHPARRRVEGGGEGERVRWSTVASWTARTVHAEMQFDRVALLAGRNEYPAWGYRPAEGVLPREDCERLASLLHPFTSTPDVCWFGIWEGYGFLDPKRHEGLPRVKTPERTYILYRGPLQAVTAFSWGQTWQSPNLWWPDDRAWCVATEIDLPETYVGGSEAAIDRVVADSQLEALRTRLDARVDIDADTINPPAP
jgi:hypothetical protein